ncbi:hypothetical protein [Candidatus Ruminimicrobiellum ovillum]|uniref:hypothetical protein n=1 Tax=Candidatus Ruminimicrobiellum ovillum TaxID=1947927 RepID=UPI003559A36D
MKTKEKETKPTKKTDETTEKKADNIKLYIPKTTTMELIMSVLYNCDKDCPREDIDTTIDEITGDYINKKMGQTIIKYTIPFSEKKDEQSDFDAEAEEAEDSYIKRFFNYKLLSKDKKYSFLDFCNDMGMGIGYHLDLRTAGARFFDYERYRNDIVKEEALEKYITYRLDFYTLLNTKGFYITIKDREELEKCLKRYIDFFIEDKLINKENTNIYNYKTHLKKAVEFFQKEYEDCGKKLTIDCEEYKNKDKKFRLIECLLALQQQGYIKINKFFYKDENLNILITFLKNPKAILNEIETLEKKHYRWIEYGDLKVDKDLGLAQYKDNPIKKLNKASNEFKVLCYLIEHPNKVIHVKKLIEITKSNKDFKGYRKAGRPSKEIEAKILEELDFYMEKIKVCKNDIQKKLGITDDKERTIQISQSKPGFILHKIAKI